MAYDTDIADLKSTVKAELERIGKELDTKAVASAAELKAFGDQTVDLKNSVDKLLTEQTKFADMAARLADLEQKGVRKGGDGDKPDSIGMQVIANELLKGGSAVLQTSRETIRIPVKNAMYSADLGANIIEPDRQAGVLPRLKQRLFVRDLIPAGRTTSNAIWWVQQTGFTNNADVVSEGVRKPESTIAFELKQTPVATIAHYFKAAKQLLDDMPALQSTVDDELRYGLKYAEEQQVLLGDGTSVNLHGIVPQATAFAPSLTVALRTQIDDIRDAMLQATLARLPPTGIVMHFTEWAEIETTKDSTGQYIFSNPLRLATPNLWGLPIVETEISSFANHFLLGAFAGGAMILDREDANVVIATENEDDFVKNMITIRCEERLGLQVKRPEAFIYGEFTSNT